MSGEEVKNAVIIDVKTGEIREYNINLDPNEVGYIPKRFLVYKKIGLGKNKVIRIDISSPVELDETEIKILNQMGFDVEEVTV